MGKLEVEDIGSDTNADASYSPPDCSICSSSICRLEAWQLLLPFAWTLIFCFLRLRTSDSELAFRGNPNALEGVLNC